MSADIFFVYEVHWNHSFLFFVYYSPKNLQTGNKKAALKDGNIHRQIRPLMQMHNGQCPAIYADYFAGVFTLGIKAAYQTSRTIVHDLTSFK
jgi:hypothetical protein